MRQYRSAATTRARGGALAQIRSFFRHHQRAGVDVGRDKIRRGLGIDDAQPFDTPRALFRIARHGLVRSHPAGARRMMRDQATRNMTFGPVRRSSSRARAAWRCSRSNWRSRMVRE
jgi:hypothetical protein